MACVFARCAAKALISIVPIWLSALSLLPPSAVVCTSRRDEGLLLLLPLVAAGC